MKYTKLLGFNVRRIWDMCIVQTIACGYGSGGWYFTYLLLVGTYLLGLLGFVIVDSEVLIISIIFITNKANFSVYGPSSN